jgi:hypothetical protein
VPRWLKASPEVARTKAVQRHEKAAQRPMAIAISTLTKGFHAKEKAPMILALRLRSPKKTSMVMAATPVKSVSVKVAPTLNCGPSPSISPTTLGNEMSIKDLGVADCKTYFGDE